MRSRSALPGLDDTFLTWSVFAPLLISAAITALQAFQFWRFGAGHIVLSCPAALFIAIMVATISAVGPATFVSLLVVCCVIQVALAWWLPTLRRIFTPVVTGTVTMLIAVSVLPITFDRVQDLPAGAPTVSGPVIAAVTLLVSVIVTLHASGRWRLVGPPAPGCRNFSSEEGQGFEPMVPTPDDAAVDSGTNTDCSGSNGRMAIDEWLLKHAPKPALRGWRCTGKCLVVTSDPCHPSPLGTRSCRRRSLTAPRLLRSATFVRPVGRTGTCE